MNDKTKQFELVDQAVRTSADRISTETRRQRREFNGTVQHFALDPRVVEELSQEGHLCFCNDDLKGHIQYLQDIGYRFVTNREAYGGREDLNPDERVKVRYGTANEKGEPQDIYLMLQRWEWYNEDQAALQKMNSKLEKAIVDGEKDVEREVERVVTYARSPLRRT